MLDILHQVWIPILEYALRLGMLFWILVRDKGTPVVRLAWLMVIFAFPFVGAFIYLLVGETHFGRFRMRRYHEVRDQLSRAFAAWEAEHDDYEAVVPERYRRMAAISTRITECAPTRGNRVTLLDDPVECIDEIVVAIENARSTCHLLFFIYLADNSGHRVAEALMDAARRGVTTRLLVDSVGARKFLKTDLCAQMRDEGVHVAEALPANLLRMLFARVDLRNHRKIVVVDGTIAFTGSRNLADARFALKPKYGPWQDAMIRIEGPAVHDLQRLFVQDWCLEHDCDPTDIMTEPPPAVPRKGIIAQSLGTGPDSDNDALHHFFQTACHTANQEIVMTTPYFVPDEGTLAAITAAANSGVRTVLVVPARNDSPLAAAASRSLYTRIIDAGVTLYEHQNGLLHTKTLTIDGEVAVLGSANIDRRSLELNFEVITVMYDESFAADLRDLQDRYISESDRIDPELWAQRPWHVRLWQNAVGILSPIL